MPAIGLINYFPAGSILTWVGNGPMIEAFTLIREGTPHHRD
jgi:hypothetical protein